ncbi:MAG: hypothetical protein P4L99_28945 [Chthoniobacter sp.]|nr:hypothetical protein [Chthoniobacter sp.]
MKNVKAIKGALNNFVATYTSRNADYDGYWLFGLLVEDLTELKFDLLKEAKDLPHPTPSQFAEILAAKQFRHQMQSAGVSVARITEALLEITKSSDATSVMIGDRAYTSHLIHVCAQAKSNHGRLFKAETSVFAAPHSFFLESRSTRRL